jgi:hypothetical protein
MNSETAKKLEIGDVVQIDPEFHLDGFFAGCFMVVTELKPWGAQGAICVPNGPRGSMPGQAYCRATWDEMEYVGKAVWIPG